MNKHSGSFLLLSILLFSVVFTGFLIFNPLNPIDDPSEILGSEYDENALPEPLVPKTSATLTYNITIDADAVGVGANNWTWAVSQSWCSGSGTGADPYLINGYTIYLNNTANQQYACINISNSHNVYFNISDCIVRNNASDFGIGIALTNCHNGVIDTVTASNNGDDGIYLVNCRNITIDTSTMNSNHHYGLNMDNTTICTMTTCTMNLNTLGGGSLINCTYNLFQTTCNFNNDTTGLTLIDSDSNNITACNFYNITVYGLEIYNSDGCIITNNDIEDNTLGIFIYDEGGDSEANELYGNDFDTNTNNAEDNSTGIGNTWDNGANSGNQWDDYPGADLDDDGIGDDPYNVSGSALAQDNYPVWDDGDSIAPAITISAPTTSGVYTIAPNFSITIVEAVAVHTRWYTVDGGITNTTFNGTIGTINADIWAGISCAPRQVVTVVLTFYANDTTGNLGSRSVTIRKYIPPRIGEDESDWEKQAYYVGQVLLIGLVTALFLGFVARGFYYRKKR